MGETKQPPEIRDIKLSTLLDTLEKEAFAKRNDGKSDRIKWLVNQIVTKLESIKTLME